MRVEIWSAKLRVSLNMKPRLRADFTDDNMVLSGFFRDGCWSFKSCVGRPIIMNSDLDWFRQSRFEDIQSDTAEMVF